MIGRDVGRRQVMLGLGALWASLLVPRFISAATTGKTQRVSALLDRYVTAKKIAGAVAVIGTREQSIFVHSGHVAFTDGAAVAQADSLWRIYSMTKLVTGAAAALLIEDKKLSLETPVVDILPSFRSPRVLTGIGSETRSAKTEMTVRHLMTHTSGLVGSMVPEPPLSTFYVNRKLNVARVSLEEDAKVQHQDSLHAFASAAGTVPLAFDPGTQWSYGISSDVLGGVIEQVAGVPFRDFIEQRIFHPLGMVDTAFEVDPTKLSRFATNYEVSAEGLKAIDAPPQSIFAKPPPFPYPSSGLVSSARDFARFSAMLLGEGALRRKRVLAAETARMMMSNLLPKGITAFGHGWGAGGVVLASSNGEPTPFGVSPGTYGWRGAAGTIAWVDRMTGIYAVLMTQYMPSEAYELHSDLTTALVPDALH